MLIRGRMLLCSIGAIRTVRAKMGKGNLLLSILQSSLSEVWEDLALPEKDRSDQCPRSRKKPPITK